MIGAPVVFVNVSSQRAQLACPTGVSFLTSTEREISTPPSGTACVVVKRSTPSKVRPNPRISSPLKRGAGVVETQTLIPP